MMVDVVKDIHEDSLSNVLTYANVQWLSIIGFAACVASGMHLKQITLIMDVIVRFLKMMCSDIGTTHPGVNQDHIGPGLALIRLLAHVLQHTFL